MQAVAPLRPLLACREVRSERVEYKWCQTFLFMLVLLRGAWQQLLHP